MQGDLIAALAKDFAEQGEGAIRIVRWEEPVTYLKIVVSVLPKEFVLENALTDLDDDELDQVDRRHKTALA